MNKKDALQLGFSFNIKESDVVHKNLNKFNRKSSSQQIVDDKDTRFAYYNAHQEKKPSGDWLVKVTPEYGTDYPNIVQENMLYSGYIKSYRPFSKCTSFNEITKYCLEVVLKIKETEYIYKYYSNKIQEDELLERLIKKHKIKTDGNRLKLSDLIDLKVRAKLKKYKRKVYISEII